MFHQPFLDLLEKYRDTASPSEYGVIDKLGAYVGEYKNCFERIPSEGARHIAASVLLVTSDFGRALFLWHKKIQCWTQPGGHADGSADIVAVAQKELEEETGITQVKLASPIPLDVCRFDYAPEVFGYRKSIYNVCFIAILPEGQEPKIGEPEKCEAMRWATPEEAREMISPTSDQSTERLIQKWIRFRENQGWVEK